jgi:DNA-binding XRE family transcriptional regulator
MQAFAQRLQQLREKAGLTQKQLADASGVNVWAIRGYEQGRREPKWKVAIQLARALGVTVEAFADCSSQDEPACEEAAPKRGRGRPTRQTCHRGQLSKESSQARLA